MCSMCGDPRHEAKDCDVKMAIKCPECGSGTYVHTSGVIACGNAFCSWVDSEVVESGN